MVLIIVLLLVVAAGAGAYFMLSGDDEGDGEGGGSPEEVARQYMQAVIDGDCEAAVGMIASSSSRDALLADCQATVSAPSEFVPAEVVSVTPGSVTDTAATVTVEFRTGSGATESYPFELVKVDGNWRISYEVATAPDPSAESGGSTDEPGGSTDEPEVGDDGGSSSEPSDEMSAIEPPPDTPDAGLASLAQDCYEGDMAYCDQLYWSAEPGSELHEYGATCGSRFVYSQEGDCEGALG